MPKKTNKTDHVLNLLSGASRKDESDTEQLVENKNLPPVDPLGRVPNVSVVHTSDKEEDPVADAIRSSLEKEMDKTDVKNDVIKKASEETTKKKALTAVEKPDVVSEPKAERQVEEIEEAPVKAIVEVPIEKDYEFVNVIERLVRDKVEGYMKQFGNCTCERCVEDTTALALTHLPPKYVVVNKASVSPLLNFYTSKYAGQITVEITKACITVQNSPHH